MRYAGCFAPHGHTVALHLVPVYVGHIPTGNCTGILCRKLAPILHAQIGRRVRWHPAPWSTDTVQG